MKKRKLFKIIFQSVDFFSAFLAWIIFFFVRKIVLKEPFETPDYTLYLRAFIIANFWVFLYYLHGMYSGIVFRKSRIRETYKLFQSTLIGSVILFFILLLDDEGVKNYKLYYKTFSSLFVIHFITSFIFKILLINLTHRLVRVGHVFFNTIVVGSGKKAKILSKELLSSDRHLGFKLAGFVHVFENNIKSSLVDETRHFGSYKNLEKVVRRANIEEVIIAIEPKEHEKIEKILTILDDCNVSVRIIPDLYQIMIGSVKVNNVLGTPLIEINRDLMPVWQKLFKRIFDLFVSIFVLIFGFPLFLFVSIMVKLSSKGPIIYSQERIGLYGKPFNIYKFRSMYINAEHNGPALSSNDDNRITPWGKIMRKTRLDEIPQFINVLKGEMSLVGPRPERKYFIDQIIEKAPYYKHIHKVKPGITSLGMVKFGYAENINQMIERLKYDILYMENLSLALDFKVLLYTIVVILQRKGK